MDLKIYKSKRNFNKTSEPTGKKSLKNIPKNLYIIQKHAASHLHYDFRLELNGVLLSWAIPKGPCLDPGVKRLAMHVEDHPVEYGSFEGIIPKGQYGGGTVLLWDKGEWLCDEDPVQAYKNGKLTFVLQAEKLKGQWRLFRINKNDKTWLLVKVKDKYAKPLKKYDILKEEPDSVLTHQPIEAITKFHREKGNAKKTVVSSKYTSKSKKHFFPQINLPRADFPKNVSPALATLVKRPPAGKNWLHEIKYDGYRILAFKENKSVTLITRNNNNWTKKFKSIEQELAKFTNKNYVLDGEIVVLDKNAKSNFQLLQNAIKEGKSNFIYYIFDVLYYDKYNLTGLPLSQRKAILQAILPHSKKGVLRYSEHLKALGSKIFQHACKLGLEGIISKDKNSPYSQTRTQQWLKTKCIKRQEFIIGGIVAPRENKRKLIRSLMLGTLNNKQELVYHGNVGTGFTEASIKEIHTLLKKYQTDIMPFTAWPPLSKNAIWLKPVVLCEVEFTEWTDDNYLRHPSFKGIRKDKDPTSVIKEEAKSISQLKLSKNSKNNLSTSTLKLTHADKLLYPDDNITKQTVANYYAEIQERILPYIINRPLTLVRCPDSYTNCFYQKHIAGITASDIHEIVINEKKGEEDYIYIKNEKGLLSLPQLGVLEIHAWGSTIKNIEYPDVITFDLDPAPDLAWKKVVKAAFDIKSHLEKLKLKCFIKTTGGKGLHVVIPILPEYKWDEIKNFCHRFVEILVEENPQEYVGQMMKTRRTGKVFIDYLRNGRGATTISPYSTRARTHAPVATPLGWDELTNNRKDTFYTLKTLPARLAKISDPWKNFFKIKQSLKI